MIGEVVKGTGEARVEYNWSATCGLFSNCEAVNNVFMRAAKVDKIAVEALSLPAAQRASLAHKLISSLDRT